MGLGSCVFRMRWEKRWRRHLWERSQSSGMASMSSSLRPLSAHHGKCLPTHISKIKHMLKPDLPMLTMLSTQVSKNTLIKSDCNLPFKSREHETQTNWHRAMAWSLQEGLSCLSASFWWWLGICDDLGHPGPSLAPFWCVFLVSLLHILIREIWIDMGSYSNQSNNLGTDLEWSLWIISLELKRKKERATNLWVSAAANWRETIKRKWESHSFRVSIHKANMLSNGGPQAAFWRRVAW